MTPNIPYENSSCNFCQQAPSPEGLTGPGSRFHDVLLIPHVSLPVPNQKGPFCERHWSDNEKTGHRLEEIFTKHTSDAELVAKICKEFF